MTNLKITGRITASIEEDNEIYEIDIIYRYFHPPKHKLQVHDYRQLLDLCCHTWSQSIVQASFCDNGSLSSGCYSLIT